MLCWGDAGETLGLGRCYTGETLGLGHCYAGEMPSLRRWEDAGPWYRYAGETLGLGHCYAGETLGLGRCYAGEMLSLGCCHAGKTLGLGTATLGRRWVLDVTTLGRRWEDAGTRGEGGGGQLVCCTAGVVTSRLSPRGLLTCRQVAEVKNPSGCPLI